MQRLADKRYQEIVKLHANSRLPQNQPRVKQLILQDLQMNQTLETVKFICEHVIGKLKVLKILAERYRNRTKRFGLRFNLIVGLYNYQLSLFKSS